LIHRRVFIVYLQRVTIHPNPGTIASARALLLARVKGARAGGQQIALGELVVGRHAPEFQINILFSDLAAFEAQRKRNQADATFQKFAAKLATMLRKPVGIDLFEMLVTMPGTEPSSTAGRARRKAK
jgi:hypothetical protein